MTVSEIADLGRALSNKAGLTLSTWGPLRFLKEGQEVIRRIPPEKGLKYLGAVRWLFHGQFSGQDKWMVEVTDAPPERLYRPDDSLLQWRKLAEDVAEERSARLAEGGLTPEDAQPEIVK